MERLEAKVLRLTPPLGDLGEIGSDELVVAFVAAMAESVTWQVHTKRELDLPSPHLGSVAACLLRLRLGDESARDRPDYKSVLATIYAAMRREATAGLFEVGKTWEGRHNSTRDWFLSPAGRQRAQEIAPAALKGQRRKLHYWLDHDRPVSLEVARTLALVDRVPRPPFVEEMEAQLPKFMATRRAEQAKGRQSYIRWVERTRKRGEPVRLWFEDGEVLEAVRTLAADGELVSGANIMDELAPGKRTMTELGRLSYQLTRLHRAGKIRRDDRYQSAAGGCPMSDSDLVLRLVCAPCGVESEGRADGWRALLGMEDDDYGGRRGVLPGVRPGGVRGAALASSRARGPAASPA
jgi:hypothetical protein